VSKLLFDSQPLVVDPELAVAIGLNEAIVLQQIHYWVNLNRKAGKNYRDGYYWTYNSVAAWCKQFPFWGRNTVDRTLASLRKQNLIIVANYNKMKMDKTNWYRVNHEALEQLREAIESEEKKQYVDQLQIRQLRESMKDNSTE